MIRTFRLTILLVLLALPGTAPLFGAPARNGFEQAGLDAIQAVQQALINEKICLSNVATVVRKGQLVYHRAVDSEFEGDRGITDETLFPIWSMTKPVTSVAAMILHERGLFQLDDAVDRAIPQLARLRVKVKGGGDPVPMTTPITYRHLLTHTAGFYGYDGSFHEEGTWKEVMELNSLAELIDLLEKKPLEHQPGERYTYGLSTAVLGRAIEVLTGQSLEAFFEKEIFGPLGMKDTRFYLTPTDRERFQPLFVNEKEKGFRLGTAAEDELYYDPKSALYLGGEGLVSTVDDYGRFCQMLVDRGRPILAPETLDLMLTDQLGENTPGYGGKERRSHFGLGFDVSRVVAKDAADEGGEVPAGIFGWGGYHTTHFWIDPVNELYAIFMTRLYPSPGEALKRFRAAVYGALVE